ncbi:MAG TPA: molybdopterin-synthase adenylyltransferase MoeB [bacterium]|nr:molybdopterin-synthase adenylyltransferase MoeB [bacterium]
MTLREDQILRYSRHILLPEVGGIGQERLARARVLCVGAGGLGSPAILYLAAAGVGRLGIVDGDAVDLTNLQRQVLHGTPDVGVPKVESAARAVARLNPDVQVDGYPFRLDAGNARELIGRYELVLDGSDNFPTRFLVNDACYFAGVPLVSACVLRFSGYLSTFSYAPGTPCYRCLYPAPPPVGSVPSCSEAGILGAIAGVMGTLQASEALKWLLELGEPAVGKLVTYDALKTRFDTKFLRRDPACPLCGQAPSITELRMAEGAWCEG